MNIYLSFSGYRLVIVDYSQLGSIVCHSCWRGFSVWVI
uniref:Uncharacterized protein n=1 Tax=Rhizophora mucronata TaxID=61149 RepID=A0A2P2J1J8_RHIMU